MLDLLYRASRVLRYNWGVSTNGISLHFAARHEYGHNYTRHQQSVVAPLQTSNPVMSEKSGFSASPARKVKPSLDRRHESNFAEPYKVIVGVDEAGRGPLCGPVVAAACIIPHHGDLILHGIMDSKKLTDEKEREEIYERLISDTRVMWCTSVVSNHEIDSINILQASLAAMKRATIGILEKYSLCETATFVALIDGNKTPDEMPIASKCVIKVFKAWRDQKMF